MVTLGDGNLERYRCNQIIVLIAHIVALFMNEVKPISLFNATQILDIPIGETQAVKSAVVFIVLIVIIVLILPENCSTLFFVYFGANFEHCISENTG